MPVVVLPARRTVRLDVRAAIATDESTPEPARPAIAAVPAAPDRRLERAAYLYSHPDIEMELATQGGPMSSAAQMLKTYPRSFNLDADLLAQATDALLECAQACTACADACLAEDDVAALVKCIRTNLDCADICDATMRVVSRQTEYDANVTRAQLQACAQACKSCGDECQQHAQHGMEHCRVCADACRRCGDACHRLIDAIA